MSLRLKAVLLAGIFLITAFAFAENGGQLQPAASVAVSQPAAVAALPAIPAAQAAPAMRETPLGVTYGIDGRLRSDNYDNVVDETKALNDETRFYRVRTRVFFNLNLSKNVDFYWREAQEFYKRTYATCGSATATCHASWGDPVGKSVADMIDSGDIWVDNAFLNFKSMGGGLKGTTLKVGRFDFGEGDGWFAWAGAPGAGPKYGAWDGFLLTYTHGKHALEVIATENDRIDNFFPVINQNFTNASGTGNHGPWSNNDMGDLGGIIAYYKNRQLKNTDIDGYYSFNRQDNMLPPGYSSVTPFSATEYAALQFQPDRYWHGFGGRVVARLPQHIDVHANYTYETGQQAAMTAAHNNKLLPITGTVNGVPLTTINGYPQVQLRAQGFEGIADWYMPKVKMKPTVGFAYAYMSGSDPKKPGTDGNFYAAFGEWSNTSHPGPLIEEGYSLPSPFLDVVTNTVTKEVGVAPAYFTNYISYYPRVAFTPYQGKNSSVKVYGGYDYVNAPHPYMGNSAHYNQDTTYALSLATPQLVAKQLLTPVIASGAGVPPQFNQTTLSGLHRWTGYMAEVQFVPNKSFSGYMSWNRLLFGNFYNSTWTAPSSTGVGTVTATRTGAQYFRAEMDYRFSGFTAYNKIPKL